MRIKMFLRETALETKLIHLVRQREIKDSAAYAVSQRLHVTENLVARLGLEKELEGHGGCVNCLEWNESGQILASASDDMHVILWDPFRYKKKLELHAGHNGNIFSVKFMPKSNDSILVTGAGDCRVRVHDVSSSETILACRCHSGRVKRIATAQSEPFMFWTAGEDGLILQFDMRTPHSCIAPERKNILINLVNHLGRYAEAKCIALNTRRPESIAVGANDAYIRMYDRRMIKISTLQVIGSGPSRIDWERSNSQGHRAGEGDLDNNIPLGCAQYFIAGHLRKRNRDEQRSRSLAATYITFSPDGTELLANMGGEQIYLFDVNDVKSSKSLPGILQRKRSPEETDQPFTSNGVETEGEIPITDYSLGKNTALLPPHVEEIKLQANKAFERQKYTLAINLYNEAINHCPSGAVLYGNRAAALMKRSWDGDIYAALRDCRTTLILDPSHVKAHFRLARCLYDLNRPVEAYKTIESFQEMFPVYSSHSACRALRKDIRDAMIPGKDGTPINEPALERTSSHEKEWRKSTVDYKMRFCGHCNTTTDIKEANYFGRNGQYIVAGSDDGSFFIWDRATTNIVRVLRGDDSIVNCLQPHPSMCLLATSGIDPVIRLWSPLPEDGRRNDREIQNRDDAASANQLRMNSDPFELMLINMGYRFPGQQSPTTDNNDDDGQMDTPVGQPLNCRPS